MVSRNCFFEVRNSEIYFGKFADVVKPSVRTVLIIIYQSLKALVRGEC